MQEEKILSSKIVGLVVVRSLVLQAGTLIEHILLDYVNTFPHLFISKQYTLCQESERFFWWLSTIFQFMNLSKLHRRYENCITMKRVGGLYSEGHLSTMSTDSSPPKKSLGGKC